MKAKMAGVVKSGRHLSKKAYQHRWRQRDGKMAAASRGIA
jgi:hypothetical protein